MANHALPQSRSAVSLPGLLDRRKPEDGIQGDVQARRGAAGWGLVPVVGLVPASGSPGCLCATQLKGAVGRATARRRRHFQPPTFHKGPRTQQPITGNLTCGYLKRASSRSKLLLALGFYPLARALLLVGPPSKRGLYTRHL